MRPVPLLIVSLPGRSAAACRGQAVAAARAGADIAEVRLDRWDDAAWGSIAQLFPAPLPLLATYRSRSQGGDGEDAPALRAAKLSACGRLPFAWIDYERGRDLSPVERDGAARAILSEHRTRPCSREQLREAHEASPSAHGLLKFVAPATVGEFLHDWLPVLREPSDRRRIAATTGPSGALARLWADRLQEPAVFARLPYADSVEAPVEPAQPPVDQLRRTFDSDESRCFAVIGSPIDHSLSPAIHARWLAAEGRAAAYVAVEPRTEEEVRGLASLGRSGWWAGWNVTSPWKPLAASLADESSSAVEATGAANTLTFASGRLRAELTDVDALDRRLRELRALGRWSGDDALVVGTGGAARAALYALRASGSASWVLGREPALLGDRLRDLGARPVRDRGGDVLELVIHATTVGRTPGDSLAVPIDPWVGPGTFLLDLVYGADTSELARVAERRGAAYEDGRRLLVYQAAASHRVWWGQAPSEPEVLGALRSVGCAG